MWQINVKGFSFSRQNECMFWIIAKACGGYCQCYGSLVHLSTAADVVWIVFPSKKCSLSDKGGHLPPFNIPSNIHFAPCHICIPPLAKMFEKCVPNMSVIFSKYVGKVGSYNKNHQSFCTHYSMVPDKNHAVIIWPSGRIRCWFLWTIFFSFCTL